MFKDILMMNPLLPVTVVAFIIYVFFIRSGTYRCTPSEVHPPLLRGNTHLLRNLLVIPSNVSSISSICRLILFLHLPLYPGSALSPPVRVCLERHSFQHPASQLNKHVFQYEQHVFIQDHDSQLFVPTAAASQKAARQSSVTIHQ
jgi:hypothetical protein